MRINAFRDLECLRKAVILCEHRLLFVFLEYLHLFLLLFIKYRFSFFTGVLLRCLQIDNRVHSKPSNHVVNCLQFPLSILFHHGYGHGVLSRWCSHFNLTFFILLYPIAPIHQYNIHRGRCPIRTSFDVSACTIQNAAIYLVQNCVFCVFSQTLFVDFLICLSANIIRRIVFVHLCVKIINISLNLFFTQLVGLSVVRLKISNPLRDIL